METNWAWNALAHLYDRSLLTYCSDVKSLAAHFMQKARVSEVQH
jgi:hypothetical protein